MKADGTNNPKRMSLGRVLFHAVSVRFFFSPPSEGKTGDMEDRGVRVSIP